MVLTVVGDGDDGGSSEGQQEVEHGGQGQDCVQAHVVRVKD